MTDEGLRCFIAWCRLNSPSIVTNRDVARRVHAAYAAMPSAQTQSSLITAVPPVRTLLSSLPQPHLGKETA